MFRSSISGPHDVLQVQVRIFGPTELTASLTHVENVHLLKTSAVAAANAAVNIKLNYARSKRRSRCSSRMRSLKEGALKF